MEERARMLNRFRPAKKMITPIDPSKPIKTLPLITD